MNTHESVTVDFTAMLLDTLRFTDGEFVSLAYEDTAGVFHTAVLPPADAIEAAAKLPHCANAYFGVNPVTGPARTHSGRGKEADVTRLTALWCDLDVKPGDCQNLDVARAIVATLGIIFKTRPSVTVDSDHGLHAYWPISDGHISDGGTASARALLKRWGRLVSLVAAKLDVAVDNVFDLPRMMRLPGSMNNKSSGNGAAPLPVTAHADTGGPLTVAEIDERLTEVGIDEEDGDADTGREIVCPPAEWTWAVSTCGYVNRMIDGWATDVPPARHPWLVSGYTRLACAHRLGCISEENHRRGRQVLEDRFTELVRTTEPRREPRRFEIEGKEHSAREYGITRAAAKTDAQARAELGDHEHPADVDEVTAETYSAAKDHKTDEAPSWQFVDGATFILDIPPTIPALWGEAQDVLWAAGESLMIAGPMGLGKTTLGLRLLRARLGLGDGTLLGYPVAPCDGKMLYLAMDRPAQIARAAYRMFNEEEREILRERVKFWKGPPPVDLAKQYGILTALAEAAEAAEVYLDSVKDAAIGLSEDEVGAGYNRARQQLLSTGRQLAEMHHTTKRGQGGGPPTAVADIYGSAWITNGTGSIILLNGEPGDPIVNMRHVRAPADEVGPFQLLHDQAAGEITVYHSADLLALAVAQGINGLSAKQAAGAMFGAVDPAPAQVERVRRKLNKLVADGLLQMVEGSAEKAGGTPPRAWFPTDRWDG